jgi:hypothetical protein
MASFFPSSARSLCPYSYRGGGPRRRSSGRIPRCQSATSRLLLQREDVGPDEEPDTEQEAKTPVTAASQAGPWRVTPMPSAAARRRSAPMLDRAAGLIGFPVHTPPALASALAEFLAPRGVRARVPDDQPPHPEVQLLGIPDLDRLEALIGEWVAGDPGGPVGRRAANSRRPMWGAGPGRHRAGPQGRGVDEPGARGPGPTRGGGVHPAGGRPTPLLQLW